MKQFKNLLFENQDGLGILTMNRPAALNALFAAKEVFAERAAQATDHQA